MGEIVLRMKAEIILLTRIKKEMIAFQQKSLKYVTIKCDKKEAKERIRINKNYATKH